MQCTAALLGQNLWGREGGTGAFAFPHCSRGLQLWCVGYYNASCLPWPILGQLLNEMRHFSWLTRPPRIRSHPGLLTRHRKLWIAKFANWQRGSQMVWEFERQQLQICNSVHIFFSKTGDFWNRACFETTQFIINHDLRLKLKVFYSHDACSLSIFRSAHNDQSY